MGICETFPTPHEVAEKRLVVGGDGGGGGGGDG